MELLSDRLAIIVDLEEKEEVKSIIVLPGQDEEAKKKNTGVVQFTGPGRLVGDKINPVAVQPGDKIVFAPFAGTELSFNGQAYLILREADVIAII